MTTATASWSCDRLVDALARRGWGDLDGPAHAGQQRVLQALVALLPYDSGEGHLTAAQVADAASLSTRWTRHCLHALEARGLIRWRRGWLDAGRPRPGFIRVVKTRLAAMVRAARDALDDRRTQRRATTRHRLATTLHRPTVPPWKRRHPLSRLPELSSTLPIPMGRTEGAFPAQPPLPPNIGDAMLCEICGLDPVMCEQTDRKVPRALRHEFTPTTPRVVPVIIDPRRTTQHPTGPAPKGWRAATHPTPPTLDLTW